MFGGQHSDLIEPEQAFYQFVQRYDSNVNDLVLTTKSLIILHRAILSEQSMIFIMSSLDCLNTNTLKPFVSTSHSADELWF